MMPVPRALSASCGICVRFGTDLTDELIASLPEDVEALYRIADGGFDLLWEAE